MPIYSPTGFLDVTNATLRGSKIVTTSNVGVANLNPLNTLSVGSNLQVEDTGSNVLTIRGNAAAAAMTLGVITVAPSYSLEIVSNIGNTVSNTIQFTNETTGFVSDSNIEVGTGNLFVNTSTGLVSVGNALSVNGRADLTDLHASNLTVDGALYANASTGRVGINTTNPGDFNLDVHGSANVGALTATDVIVTGNLAVAGELTSIRSTTVNVDDPIIGLANNNTSDPAVLDIGFVMARPSTATGSNVAIIFDESSDTLEIGYTTGKHTDTTITIDDSTLFHTNIHGNVAVSNLEVGQFSVVAAYGLDHVTNENNSTGDTIISTNGTTGLQTTANVSVGRDALVSGNVEVSKELTVSGNVEVSKELTVSGNVEVSKELTVTGNVEVSKELTVSGNVEVSKELTVSGNVEVGTANLFVDTLTGNVGIGTNSPATYLHLSAKNSDPGATEGDFVGTHNLTEYLRFTSRGDGGDVNSVSVGFKLGSDDNHTLSPDGRLDICANDGSSVANSYGKTPDKNIATFLGSGNVGIGRTDPEAPLHVQGARSIFGNNGGASDIIINDIPQARWKIATGGYGLSFSKHSSASDEYSTWSEKVRIDQNGYIKHANTSFLAYSDNGNANYDKDTPIILEETQFNVGSSYSTSTGAFTAPVSGYYQLNAVIFNNSSNGIQFSFLYRSSSSGTWDSLLLGGDEYVWSHPSTGASSSSVTLKLSSGNQIAIGHRNDATYTIYRAHTHFSGFLISPS